eukprot:TRINITY_DN21435_c0_g1_i2.p1 TRINITY_DN21435_c0_g1~~TRINITY_DN21435_c0_g1_i2.p1  ORF type:complete len:214 (-),score=30.13 TRINITY_DN21435_c0_g1_i2:108-749(-)
MPAEEYSRFHPLNPRRLPIPDQEDREDFLSRGAITLGIPQERLRQLHRVRNVQHLGSSDVMERSLQFPVLFKECIEEESSDESSDEPSNQPDDEENSEGEYQERELAHKEGTTEHLSDEGTEENASSEESPASPSSGGFFLVHNATSKIWLNPQCIPKKRKVIVEVEKKECASTKKRAVCDKLVQKRKPNADAKLIRALKHPKVEDNPKHSLW